MRYKYVVRWYEYNLTNMKCRNFFTVIGASIYKWYLQYCKKINALMYEYYE